MFDIRRQDPDVAAVWVASVQGGDGRSMAINETIAATRAEHDVVVGKISWFDVIPWSICQLPQPRAVTLYLVQVVGVFSSAPIGKENTLTIVMNLGIPYSASRVIEKNGRLSRANVHAQEPSALAETGRDQFVGHAVLGRILGDG